MKKILLLSLTMFLIGCAADDGTDPNACFATTEGCVGQDGPPPPVLPDAWEWSVEVAEVITVVAPPGGTCNVSLEGVIDVTGLTAPPPVITQWWEVPCNAVDDLGDAWGLWCDSVPTEAGPDAEGALTFVVDKETGTGEVAHSRSGTWVGGDGVPFPIDCTVIYTLTPA